MSNCSWGCGKSLSKAGLPTRYGWCFRPLASMHVYATRWHVIYLKEACLSSENVKQYVTIQLTCRYCILETCEPEHTETHLAKALLQTCKGWVSLGIQSFDLTLSSRFQKQKPNVSKKTTTTRQSPRKATTIIIMTKQQKSTRNEINRVRRPNHNHLFNNLDDLNCICNAMADVHPWHQIGTRTLQRCARYDWGITTEGRVLSKEQCGSCFACLLIFFKAHIPL